MTFEETLVDIIWSHVLLRKKIQSEFENLPLFKSFCTGSFNINIEYITGSILKISEQLN